MYDLAIINGTIIDGTGRDSYIGNIGINGNKIAYLGTDDLDARKIIDARGLTVSPGFIDVHGHSDMEFLLEDVKLESRIFQGITSEIAGNCGISIIPVPEDDHYHDLFKKSSSAYVKVLDNINSKLSNIEDYKRIFNETDKTINCGLLVGHGSLRTAAMGFDNRRPSPEEMSIMKELLDFELENGALGMSLGLTYSPGSFSEKEELIELGKVIKDHDAILTAHIRDEKDKVFEAVKEMIDLADQSGAHVHISHLKIMGKDNWGRAEDLVDLIRQANDRGIRITSDLYPYNASSTSLSAVLPYWAQEGGISKMIERINDRSSNIESEIEKLINGRGGGERIKISDTLGILPDYENKFLSDICGQLGISPSQTVIKILTETKGNAKAIYFSMSDEDVNYILSQEDIIVGSDGYGFDYDKPNGSPHPRSFGSFPRFLRMSSELEGMSKESIIKRMTAMPADYFNLKDIGRIEEGMFADITIFNWDDFTDTSTFEQPYQKPLGLNHVIVSGQVLVKDGRLTQKRPGRWIEKKV